MQMMSVKGKEWQGKCLKYFTLMGLMVLKINFKL